jgi:hypothetical protein
MSKTVYAARTIELSQYGQAKPVSLPTLPF